MPLRHFIDQGPDYLWYVIPLVLYRRWYNWCMGRVPRPPAEAKVIDNPSEISFTHPEEI